MCVCAKFTLFSILPWEALRVAWKPNSHSLFSSLENIIHNMNIISYSWNFNQSNNVLHIYAQSFHRAGSGRLVIRHPPFDSQIRSKRDSSNEKHRNAIMSIIIQNDEKKILFGQMIVFLCGKLICANIPSSTFPVARQINTCTQPTMRQWHTTHNQVFHMAMSS